MTDGCAPPPIGCRLAALHTGQVIVSIRKFTAPSGAWPKPTLVGARLPECDPPTASSCTMVHVPSPGLKLLTKTLMAQGFASTVMYWPAPLAYAYASPAAVAVTWPKQPSTPAVLRTGWPAFTTVHVPTFVTVGTTAFWTLYGMVNRIRPPAALLF